MTPPNPPPQPAPATPLPPLGRRVLLVDDSRVHRRLLALQLTRAGYEVVEASSSHEALQICASLRPHLIVSDWVMEGLSGPELCRALRPGRQPGTGYFILLTSKSDVTDVAAGLASGADDFMTKPVSGAELLARLSAGERIIAFQEELSNANRELHATLAELRATQERMESDLREARKLQLGLVRERQGTFGDIRISLLLRPAGLIGGDLVGFRRLNKDLVAFHALDVAGHGVAAALLAARMAAELESGPAAPATPLALVNRLNSLLLDRLQTDSYLTMIYGHLEPRTGRVQMICAGHPHPVLQRADGSIRSLGDGGMPVGFLPEPLFEEIGLTLDHGERLFLASDGITEATSPHGNLLGEDGLSAILQLNAPLSGNGLLESLCWSVSEFSAGQSQDDISAVLIERAPR